jgi:hypothetical protein
MDNDSFYRGRKDSFDALGGTANPTPRQQKQDDTASSFFGRNSQYTPSAGYNQQSFADPGRSMPVRGLEEGRGGGEFGNLRPASGTEEIQDPGWDVYNDFNNTGPRYSEAFGTGLSTLTSSKDGQ